MQFLHITQTEMKTIVLAEKIASPFVLPITQRSIAFVSHSMGSGSLHEMRRGCRYGVWQRKVIKVSIIKTDILGGTMPGKHKYNSTDNMIWIDKHEKISRNFFSSMPNLQTNCHSKS